jgi:hypothetical protein
MNQLKLRTRVFSIHHCDGNQHPMHYWLEEEGKVRRIHKAPGLRVVDWGKAPHFDEMYLKPSKDGFCYFMAELPDMERYKDGDLYKVPTFVLKEHMASYKSPWKFSK